MPSQDPTTTYTYGTFEESGYYNLDGSSTAKFISQPSRRAVAQKRFSQRVSTNTPGFHNPNRGRLLPNDFLYLLEVDNAPRGRTVDASPYGVKQNQYGYQYSVQEGIRPVGTADFYMNSDNPFNSYYSTSSPDIGTLDGQARNAVLNKIKGSNVNIAVATAEADKTIDMVINAATKIHGAYRDLRRGDIVSAARGLGITASRRTRSRFSKAYAKDRAKAAGSAWNEFSYGWTPLVNDVYGAVKELNGAANQGLVSTVKVRRTKETAIAFTKVTGDLANGKYTRYTQEGYARSDVTYSVSFIRKLGAQQDLPRLGITNPAVIAWELVPFSFVVDWFLPVGNFLETLDATLGCEFLTGYSTQFYRMQAIQSDIRGDKNSLSGANWQSSMTRLRVKRTRLTSFPSPSIPTFKNPASIGHLANALGLLTNLIKK